MASALLLGTRLLVAGLQSFAVAIALVVSLIRIGYTARSIWKNVAIIIAINLVMAAAHLMEIALRAAAFWATDEIPSFEQNYTTLGYGDIVLSDRWRLLGPLEAINGLLLSGLSMAAMFAALSRLVSGHHVPDTKTDPARPYG